jgi:hypothetical protein
VELNVRENTVIDFNMGRCKRSLILIETTLRSKIYFPMFVLYRLRIIGSKRWTSKSNHWRQDENEARNQEACKHAISDFLNCVQRIA